MIRVNVHEAKAQLSKYLTLLEAGETILLCRRNVPIAEIRPLPSQVTEPPPIGLAREQLGPLPLSFFEPLPESTLDEFLA